MRVFYVIILVLLFIEGCNRKQKPLFRAKKITRTASFIASGSVEKVFPLFGAFNERKIDYSWNPILIYPDTEVIDVGTTFKTEQRVNNHYTGEDTFLWCITRYEPSNNLIQYMVSTPNRYWIIFLSCRPINSEQTCVNVTYTYVSLNKQGDLLNQAALANIFKHELKDWQEATNYYLQHGRAINTPSELLPKLHDLQ